MDIQRVVCSTGGKRSVFDYQCSSLPSPKKSREDPRQQAACADARRWMLHPHLLLDENLILVLRKEHGLENLYTPEPAAPYY